MNESNKLLSAQLRQNRTNKPLEETALEETALDPHSLLSTYVDLINVRNGLREDLAQTEYKLELVQQNVDDYIRSQRDIVADQVITR